jgi:hypothetical protein
MPHPFSPLTVKKCLRSSTGEQPLVKHCSGGHTTTSAVLSTPLTLLLLLPVLSASSFDAALTPSGSTAVDPGSQGLSAVGATPSLQGS